MHVIKAVMGEHKEFRNTLNAPTSEWKTKFLVILWTSYPQPLLNLSTIFSVVTGVVLSAWKHPTPETFNISLCEVRKIRSGQLHHSPYSFSVMYVLIIITIGIFSHNFTEWKPASLKNSELEHCQTAHDLFFFKNDVNITRSIGHNR